MTEIVNLNKIRKQAARDAKQKQAQENRDRFGRTKAEKKIDQLQEEKRRTLLEGHQLEGAKPDEDA